MQDHHQKVAIITGAGIGIGYEIALQLALTGVAIVLNDIDKKAAAAAVKKIRKQGGEITGFVGDISEMETIKGMIVTQEEGGRILLMSSVTGHTYHPDLTTYGMSKAAIVFLAKTLGVELAKYQITVNAISPGATLTERTIDLEDGDEFQKQWERTTPNGKCATTEDIANTALFLLSDKAKHITSQTIIVDGGWTAMSPPPN